MSVEEVLVQVRMQLEEKIKRQLSGLQGFVAKPIYNSLMPLHLEMLTEPEAFELVFLNDGDIELKHGQSANPDVRIESDAQTLRRSQLLEPISHIMDSGGLLNQLLRSRQRVV